MKFYLYFLGYLSIYIWNYNYDREKSKNKKIGYYEIFFSLGNSYNFGAIVLKLNNFWHCIMFYFCDSLIHFFIKFKLNNIISYFLFTVKYKERKIE